ncbi:MAG: nuclear transport factor 2 family protein [Sphingobacteriales bacterium]
MKTLRSMLAGVALLFICAAANAITKPAAGKLTRDEVVKIYIDAITNGNVSKLNNILADDFQFYIKRGDYVNTLGKNGLIDYLKNNTISDTSVKTTTTVMREDDNSSVIKVEFRYAGYSRIDKMTLHETFGWVITTVECQFM